MYKSVRNILLLIPILIAFGCSSGTSEPPAASTVSSNTAMFDPSAGNVPLPNILATATAKDPMMNYSGNYGSRPANKPMTPPEALAYVNKYEMGSTNAVSGINAPIYIRFLKAVDPATVTSATVKVFQLGIDSNGLTENNALGFTDISGMFDYSCGAANTDLYLTPKFPLIPGTRYLYVVTSGVKDAATGGSLGGSFYFEALKATTPLLGAFSALEAIRANVYADPPTNTVVKLSGYAKVMDDLITASGNTTISSRTQIALMGRFITTGAGFISGDGTGSTASMLPVETALRAFAAGSTLSSLGGLSGIAWTNSFTVAATFDKNGTNPTPDAYWTAVMGAATTAPASVSSVTLGSINSADLSIDPTISTASANVGTMDLTGVTGAFNPAAGVVRPFRAGSGILTGYYHTTRSVPVVYIKPASSNGKMVIFQHGITGQKEQVIAVAGALTAAGYAVVAIDLPLHGALSPTHALVPGDSATVKAQKQALWGQDFMALGAPLATRSNIQQAAFNLHRLELTFRTGGFAAVAGAVGAGLTADIKFAGLSLGSIVGAYYLAGNTTLSTTGYPYTQTTLNSDMKGFLSVPGARLAYLMRDSAAFSPSVNAGLAAKGIAVGTPTYNQFFQVTQTIVDTVDPATMTNPLAPGLPSRLSGRLVMQEAVGDLVIPNANTRYFGSALGGRGVLGAAGSAVAPGFKQLGYSGTTSAPVPFMAPFAVAATAATDTGPTEGYFQFNQAGVSHGFLLDPTASLAATGLAQRQMVYFLTLGIVVDPSVSGAALPKVTARMVPGLAGEILLPPVLKIFGY
jgi:hypothetical protein